LPEGKSFFKKLAGIQEERRKMINEGRIDWATAELLAFGTLLQEGFSVRMSGQDVERGTFSQRHAVLKIEDSEEEYIPLKNFYKDGIRFEIYNSLLSEYGVLGFEYGYAFADPDSLTVWEAQYGDFSNGAQIIFDQFICCAEEKWNVWNGVVMLLPHGYEGQGPDHSNARIERYLSLCASNNVQVANCTTPSNYFHLLRRQLHRPFRKPLVVFTPKSLLRNPECISVSEEFTSGCFEEIIDDATADKNAVTRILFCSGKIYYELDQSRRRMNSTETAIIRIEQLYPFPLEQIQEVLRSYTNAKQWLWVQEEPVNMGAWTFIIRHMKGVPLLLVARPESGSSATGSLKLHKLRQQKIIDKAFARCDCERRTIECQMLCAPDEKNFIQISE
jgi:2-oxoglutarate dehydrogenase E1 component